MGNGYWNADGGSFVHGDALLVVELDVGPQRNELHAIELEIRIGASDNEFVKSVQHLDVVSRHDRFIEGVVNSQQNDADESSWNLLDSHWHHLDSVVVPDLAGR